ncbi:hypothetical protein DL96DRAFT_1817116 [Flagelloscypha sp. PMI_526]|nr:hypothetical protein DL96DRAFT_1817116 [Flagelloscypha sp. PMI_526]
MVWLVPGFGNIDDGSAAIIFRNIPNATTLSVDCFPRDDILANGETCDAFMKILSPLIHTLELCGVPHFGTYFLSAFTNLKHLSFSQGGLLVDSLLPDSAPLSHLERLELNDQETVAENNIACLCDYLKASGCHLREIRWSAIDKPEESPIGNRPPSLESPFVDFFRTHSQTLVQLKAETCGPAHVDTSVFPPDHHPWAPNNLPHLEVLLLPAVTTTWYTALSMRKDVKENISWITAILQNLTTSHPLRTLYINCKYHDIQTFSSKLNPWHGLDDVLQSSHLPNLEKVTILWDLGRRERLDVAARTEFKKKHLPRSFDRGIVDS